MGLAFIAAEVSDHHSHRIAFGLTERSTDPNPRVLHRCDFLRELRLIALFRGHPFLRRERQWLPITSATTGEVDASSSYTQVRFLLHSYRALVRWWLSFLVHRLSSAPRWRFALRAGSSPTSPSGSPNKSAPAAGWQSSRHGALPQHVPRLVTFAVSAPVQRRPQSPTRERILSTL